MITNVLTNDVANFIAQNINKVVINDVYEIVNFESKEVQGSSVVLNYIIPMSPGIEEITNIKIKYEDDRIMSENTVHIPMTTDHFMIQSIEVIG